MDENPPDQAPSTLRRVGVWAGAVLGTLVVLYAGLAILFQLLLDPGTVSRWIEPRAEAVLNRDVELGGARPTVFPFLGIDLTDLEVGNLPAFEGPPLARVERVRLRVALLPLLTRTIRVDQVRVDGLRIHLGVDGDGTSNFGDLVPESEERPPGEDAPLALAIRELRIVDGRMEYVSEPDSTRVALEGMEATASLGRRADDHWSAELGATSSALGLEHPMLGAGTTTLAGPSLRTRGAVDAGGGWLEVGEGELRVGEASFRLTGRIDDLGEEIRQVDLRLLGEGLAVERLAEALPDSLRDRLPGAVSGSLRLDLTATGPAGPDQRPTLGGEADFSDVSLGGEGGEALARGLSGRVLLRKDTLRTEQITGTVLGGPFSLRAVMVRDSQLPVAGYVEARPDLSRLARLRDLGDSVALAGHAEVGVSLAGALRRPADLALDGRVRLSGVEVEHPRLGVRAGVPDAALELAGRTVRWSEMEVELGPDRLRTTGRLDDPLAFLADDGARVPFVEAEVRSARLDLDRIVPPRGDPEMTYGRIVFAHLGGRSLDGGSAEDVATREGLFRPAPLPLRARIDLEADTLISAPYRLSDVALTLEAGPEMIAVPDASFGLFGGQVGASFHVALGEAPTQPFRLTMEAAGTRAADFLSATSPLRRLVNGTLGLELTADGALDGLMLPVAGTLVGSGLFRILEGGLRENPVTSVLAESLSLPGLAAPGFREWGSPFRLDGSRLLLEEGRFGTELGELGFAGAVGLDGALDLGVQLSASGSRLDSLALRRSGLASAVAGRLGGASVVRVGLRLGGTVFDPTVRPDVSLATGDIGRAVREEVDARRAELRDTAEARLRQTRDSAEARLRAEREALEARARRRAETEARGLLRGILGGRQPPPDTTAAPGPDPAPGPDSLPADTLAPDSLLPDTTPPDTTPPDTTPPDTVGGG